MPIKLNVGVSRKVGQPNYGSLGACCNVDIELDQQSFDEDPSSLHRHVQEAFAVCRHAVEAELSQSGRDSAKMRTSGQASQGDSSSPGAGETAAPRPKFRRSKGSPADWASVWLGSCAGSA